jgi:hypothetical protein
LFHIFLCQDRHLYNNYIDGQSFHPFSLSLPLSHLLCILCVSFFSSQCVSSPLVVSYVRYIYLFIVHCYCLFLFLRGFFFWLGLLQSLSFVFDRIKKNEHNILCIILINKRRNKLNYFLDDGKWSKVHEWRSTQIANRFHVCFSFVHSWVQRTLSTILLSWQILVIILPSVIIVMNNSFNTYLSWFITRNIRETLIHFRFVSRNSCCKSSWTNIRLCCIWVEGDRKLILFFLERAQFLL